MLKIKIDNLENIHVYHPIGDEEIIPHYQSDDLMQILESYSSDLDVQIEEYGEYSYSTVGELLESKD